VKHAGALAFAGACKLRKGLDPQRSKSQEVSAMRRLFVLLVVSLVTLALASCGEAMPTATQVARVETPVSTTSPTPAPPIPGVTKSPVPPSPSPSATVRPTQEPSPTLVPTSQPSPTAVETPEQQGAAEGSRFTTFGGSGDQVASHALMADDGGLFIVGTANLRFEPEPRGDIYLVRTGPSGEVLWEKTFGGEGYDFGTTIAEARDGGLLLSGFTTSFGAAGLDAYLIKVDREGNELWSRTHGGPLDERASAWEMADGSYILGGNIVDPDDLVADPGAPGYSGLSGRSSIYLARTDAEGRELWVRTYGGGDNVLASGGVQTPDGGFVILATISRFPETGDDLYLLKVDDQGDEVWSRTWRLGTMEARDLVQTTDGNYLICGVFKPPGTGERAPADWLFIKVDSDGRELWRRTFGDPDSIDYGHKLTATADGGAIVGGGTGRSLTEWDEDIVLLRIDADGQRVWEQVFETDTHNMYGAVMLHPDGSCVLVGSTFQNRGFDIFVLKVDLETAAAERSPEPPDAGIAAELVTYIENLAAEEGFSGAALVAVDGQPLLLEARSWANREDGIPNRVDTKFNLGSMNKMFTAVAILQLAEQGLLSVDDYIVDHLHDYLNPEVAEQVTIHHLLTHTSGMGNVFTEQYDATPKDRFRTVESWLPLFVAEPLYFEPGSQFGYSNAGYVVLGLIIESISGQSYYDYVMEHIFLPSSMLNTDSYELDAAVPNLAIGYTPQDREGNALGDLVTNTDQLPVKGFPAGGGYSTVEDLLRFGNALLAHRLLSPESTALLLEGKVPIREGMLYAYGFFDNQVGDQRMVGHTGGFPGICDLMEIYPEEGITVILLSNMDGGCIELLQRLREQPLR
jgi:CubicO group peptidase (beta-lactamase class C family)